MAGHEILVDFEPPDDRGWTARDPLYVPRVGEFVERIAPGGGKRYRVEVVVWRYNADHTHRLDAKCVRVVIRLVLA